MQYNVPYCPSADVNKFEVHIVKAERYNELRAIKRERECEKKLMATHGEFVCCCLSLEYTIECKRLVSIS